jgi:uncharacterized protein YjbI with pentapeptide repeats
VVAACAFAASSPSLAAPPSATRAKLENEKLRQEVLKLKHENGTWSRVIGAVPPYGALITAIVAIGGVLLALQGQTNEKRRERQRKIDEAARHREERFEGTVGSLGSARLGEQTSAAVAITTFVEPEYAEFRERVREVVLGHLKLLGVRKDEGSRVVNGLLVGSLARTLREIGAGDAEQPEINLARTSLRRIDLSGLALPKADIAYADLTGANLIGSDFYRARGIEAILDGVRCGDWTNLEEARLKGASAVRALFHKTRLISVHLEEAVLERAEFYNSRLNTAHFENASLTGAKFADATVIETVFTGADITGADFRGATFDEAALKSIVRAHNWRGALFDRRVRAKLDGYAK